MLVMSFNLRPKVFLDCGRVLVCQDGSLVKSIFQQHQIPVMILFGYLREPHAMRLKMRAETSFWHEIPLIPPLSILSNTSKMQSDIHVEQPHRKLPDCRKLSGNGLVSLQSAAL